MPCEEWDMEDGFMYMTKTGRDLWAYSPVDSGDSSRQTVNQVLGLLPGLQKIDESKYQVNYFLLYGYMHFDLNA